MRKFWPLFIIAFLSITPVWAEEIRPEIGPFVKAFHGNEGLKVWTLRIGPRSAQEALVQLGGIDHDWNKLIQKAKVEIDRDRTLYTVQLDDKKFVLLILSNGKGSVYLPDSNNEMPVSYDEALSENSNPEHFLTDFLEQKNLIRNQP